MGILSRSWRRRLKLASPQEAPSSKLFAAARHTVERLESRLLLSATTWTNAAGGDFDTIGNWSNGVPAAGVHAVIDIAVSASDHQDDNFHRYLRRPDVP